MHIGTSEHFRAAGVDRVPMEFFWMLYLRTFLVPHATRAHDDQARKLHGRLLALARHRTLIHRSIALVDRRCRPPMI